MKLIGYSELHKIETEKPAQIDFAKRERRNRQLGLLGEEMVLQWEQKNCPPKYRSKYVEVLGYHRLSPQEIDIFTEFFALAPILPITSQILDEAIKLRQLKKSL